MKAVVLSAGYGTRLGELTRDVPKAMLPIAGRPLLEHVLRHLARHGFDDVAVNLHFRGEVVRGHFGSGADFGVRITWAPEPELLGTAGTVASLRSFLDGDEPFLVHYGDVLTNHDFSRLVAAHRERGALLTLLVHDRPGSNSIVVTDDDDRIVDFLERPPADHPARARSSRVNSGVCVCDPRVLDLVPAPPCDLARDVLARVAGRPDVYAQPLEGFRVAVDSPERYRLAEEALATRVGAGGPA